MLGFGFAAVPALYKFLAFTTIMLSPCLSSPNPSCLIKCIFGLVLLATIAFDSLFRSCDTIIIPAFHTTGGQLLAAF